MLLPDTYSSALLLALLSMICWGSWANTYKLSGKWRFELFYFDYAFGVLLCALIAGFTFGSLGFDRAAYDRVLPFVDDLMDTGKRNLAFGFGAGMIFNLANMLLVGAIAVAGMSVAFPVGIGLAMIVGVVMNYVIKPQGNPTFLFGGAAVVLAAIVLDALAYRGLAMVQAKRTIAAGKTKSTIPKVSWKGIILSIASGLLMGSFYPLVELGKSYGVGFGPYGISFIFAVGILLSTFVFNLFFMNLPIQGAPVEFLDYFKGTARQHLLGIIGGMVWAVGTIANFVVSSAVDPRAPAAVQGTPEKGLLGPAISYGLGQGATLISVLWGLLVWKEFRGADGHVKALLAVMFVLFAVGLTMISVAPLVR